MLALKELLTSIYTVKRLEAWVKSYLKASVLSTAAKTMPFSNIDGVFIA